MIFAILTLSIAIILFCILVLKLNPAISLILGAIFIGLTSNIGAVTTVNKIASFNGRNRLISWFWSNIRTANV